MIRLFWRLLGPQPSVLFKLLVLCKIKDQNPYTIGIEHTFLQHPFFSTLESISEMSQYPPWQSYPFRRRCGSRLVQTFPWGSTIFSCRYGIGSGAQQENSRCRSLRWEDSRLTLRQFPAFSIESRSTLYLIEVLPSWLVFHTSRADARRNRKTKSNEIVNCCPAVMHWKRVLMKPIS